MSWQGKATALCAGGDISFRLPDLTCKHKAAPGASQKVQKWVQQHMEQLGLGCAERTSSEGKETGMHTEMALAHARYMMRDESHMKFLPPINPKVKTKHVKEQQK